MQQKINMLGNLLNKDGELRAKGYGTQLDLKYNREAIQVPKWRIKEWDYYLMMNTRYGVALTLADNGYMGLISVTLIDFKMRWYKTTSKMKMLPLGKLRLPTSSKEGDVIYKDQEIELYFLNNGVQRQLKITMKNFDKGKEIECKFILKDEPQDSMVIATPFNKSPKAFYYNQKIVGMKVKGYARYDDKMYKFKDQDSTALLDWGRGVWTYKNTWYWGSASGLVNGKMFGFNIGCGFGNTESATENMLFLDGKAHKLDQVNFNIPKEQGHFQYMNKWLFTSNDGRFEMEFVPIIDRKDAISVGILASEQHQVFGKFTGKAILDDGTVVEVKDFLGFAERVYNKW